MTHLQSLLPTLQVAIGPVILISGIGLLLLSMTNRLGRTIDRSRDLAREYRGGTADDRERAASQLHILLKRARIIRTAIALASVSVLLAALLIIALFLGALLQLDLTAPLIGTLFVGCMFSLIGSIVLFISDVNLSLRALKLEIGPIVDPRA
jgi:hypothetical protein